MDVVIETESHKGVLEVHEIKRAIEQNCALMDILSGRNERLVKRLPSGSSPVDNSERDEALYLDKWAYAQTRLRKFIPEYSITGMRVHLRRSKFNGWEDWQWELVSVLSDTNTYSIRPLNFLDIFPRFDHDSVGFIDYIVSRKFISEFILLGSCQHQPYHAGSLSP
jgi:hypothetical protein